MHRQHSVPATLLTLAAFAIPALAQQDYVGKFDAYVGYAYLNSPKIKLKEPGVQIQVGARMRSWMSLGFDYSNTSGNGVITPDLLPTALQQSLGATLALLTQLGQVPAGYALTVPISSQTQTFAAGPQFSYHGWKWVTPFIRPSMGAIREVATPKPTDPIAAKIVQGLAPAGKKQDWTGFYGAGGGADINITRHFAVRVQGDLVWDHLFNDILRDGRTTVRFSIGPAVQWGRNMK